MVGAAVLAGAVLAAGASSALVVGDTFQSPVGNATPRAVTYDTGAVPPGSRVLVGESSDDEGTRVTLRVAGLKPDSRYRAHVHTRPCGPNPADSGPHYQNTVDPKGASTDPVYANAQNEVWLGLTTDGNGDGEAEARHTWRFRTGEARSVVLHGAGGSRVACVSVAFR